MHFCNFVIFSVSCWVCVIMCNPNEEIKCIPLLIFPCFGFWYFGISEGFIDVLHMIQSLIFHEENFSPLWGHNMCIFHTNLWGLGRSPQKLSIVSVNINFWGHFCGDSKMSLYSDKSPLLWCVFISKYPQVGWGK